MHIKYKNKDLEEKCTDFYKAKKYYSDKIAIKLLRTINFITNAESLRDVINCKPFNFHSLKGNRKGQYAIDIDGRKGGYRLILKMANESMGDVNANAEKIENILVWEVSKHYEK